MMEIERRDRVSNDFVRSRTKVADDLEGNRSFSLEYSRHVVLTENIRWSTKFTTETITPRWSLNGENKDIKKK